VVPDALTDGPRFAAYCARYIRHTKGRWGGMPLTLEAWEREFWWEALEVDPATHQRVYQQVGFGLPRKNGKSLQASALGIYMLDSAGEGENEPEVYVGAAARNQAGLVMSQSINCVKRAPLLLDRLKPFRYHIDCPRNGGVMRSLSSDGALQHGLNPSCNIIDELHAHKNSDLWTALTTGTGARESPLTGWISTAGVAGEGILADVYESMFSGTGTLEDRGSLLIYRDRENGVLIYWYGAPRDADIEDPAVWLACNPASWLQDGRFLRKQLGILKSQGKLLEWRRYHLNQFLGTEQTWLRPGAFGACKCDELVLTNGLPIGVGIDKSPDGESASITVAQKQGDRMIVRMQLFTAESATGIVSTEAMREAARSLRITYPLPQTADEKTKRAIPGPAFAYEPHAFKESAAELAEEGLNMVQMPMTANIMAPPTTIAFDLITTGRLAHDGDRILAEHVANTTAVLTDRGMKVTRSKHGTQRPNVACVAMVRAIAMASQEAPKPFVRKPRKAVGF
jgi:phage terminase large subunit-like protein